MADKNLVICLDGTGNKFREYNTNVVKLFQILPRNDRQIVYYDPGVGTLADPRYKTPLGKEWTRLLGLGFGAGLTRNIVEAYTFLIDHYEPDDRIFLFGFSRGAFTARALAGFLFRCGLLERGSRNLIPYAVELYRSANFPVTARFRKTYSRRCAVHFLGLWDTVTTIGWIYNPINIPNTTNNPIVNVVRHAVAIDERRAHYRQNLWGTRHRGRQDVKEVWFAGAHSDLGGGYPEPESGLSKIPLGWIADEARRFGLWIDETAYESIVLGVSSRYAKPDPTAALHPSLSGAWHLLEWLPKINWDSRSRRRVLRRPPLGKTRFIADGSRIHASVVTRMREMPYQPANLPSVDELTSRFPIEEG